jgi:hypothetical protein
VTSTHLVKPAEPASPKNSKRWCTARDTNLGEKKANVKSGNCFSCLIRYSESQMPSGAAGIYHTASAAENSFQIDTRVTGCALGSSFSIEHIAARRTSLPAARGPVWYSFCVGFPAVGFGIHCAYRTVLVHDD